MLCRIRLLVIIIFFMPILLWGCSPRTVGIPQVQQVAVNQYVIKGEVDLEGKTIKLPKGGSLYFDKGTVRNGTIVLDNTTIAGKIPSFCDITLKGSLANQTVYSSWFKSSAGGSDYLTSVIKLCCTSSSDFVFNEGRYKFTEPIYLFGTCNLLGDGGVNIFVDMVEAPFFILAGNDTIGGKQPRTWQGKINNLNFVVNRGVFNYFVNLINVSDCEISECFFDISNNGVNCSNKIIASVNNANYSNPSKGKKIRIKNNTIKIQPSEENRNNCEPIGVESRTDVLIENNTIWNARDDLGIHNCGNVIVKDNEIYAYDGRIFVSNSTDVSINNNTIKYVSQNSTGMGVYVGVEQGYDCIPERIDICGNIVDYSQSANIATYGIRVVGANHVNITNNIIKGNDKSRIALEYTEAKPNQNKGLLNLGYLVPQHVTIKGNSVSSLWIAGFDKFDIRDVSVVDNVIDNEVSITNPKVIFRDNKMRVNTKIYAAPTKNSNIYF